MKKTVASYYAELPETLHFYRIAEQSCNGDSLYRMQAEYGSGSLRIMNFHAQFLIIIADFTPKTAFEKVSEISEAYFEISQFETESSSFKAGGKKIKQVDRGMCCYANTHTRAYAFCEPNKPTRFTKIIITKTYFDAFLSKHFGNSYEESKNSLNFLIQHPHVPELHFVFQQIKDCPITGSALKLYMEGKVIEVLALVTRNGSETQKRTLLSVKLDKKDKRALQKVITFMKHNLASYPSIQDLAEMANMSTSRFQGAFRQVYGTTVYEYLKMMRMNYALLLLHNASDKIYHTALKVGYRNAGHFSKLFKETFGISPHEYRAIHHLDSVL